MQQVDKGALLLAILLFACGLHMLITGSVPFGSSTPFNMALTGTTSRWIGGAMVLGAAVLVRDAERPH